MKRFICFLLSITLMLASASALKAQNDRAVFDLKGSVSKVEISDAVGYLSGDIMIGMLSFSPTGKLLTVNQYDITNPRNGSYWLKRNKSGRLWEISSVAGDGMCLVRFQYSKSGRLIGQTILYENEDTDAVYEGPRVSFSYDENGNRVKATIKSADSPAETISYTDYQFDEAGNWISRNASGSGQSGSKIETRKITYYSK